MIADTIANLFTRSTTSNPAQWLVDWVSGGEETSSGMRVGAAQAMTYPAVWRAVNKISRDVAKLPLFVYRRGQDGSRTKQGGHPIMRLLRRRPNDYMTGFTFKQTLQAHALLRGSGYAAINRNSGGMPESLTILLPEKTKPKVEGGMLRYETWIPDSTGAERKYTLAPDDVLHVKGLSPDGITPYSVIGMARESLGLGLAARKYGSTFFRNNARPSLIITHPGRISDVAAERMRKSWQKIYGSIDNAHKVGLVEEGATVQPLSISNEDAQFLETRQFELREIASWFGLPAHFLGDTTRTAYASLEQENQSYLDDTLDGWLATWEAEVHRKLLTVAEQRSGQFIIEFTRQALVRADLKSRYEAYAVGINNRILSPNEVRERENLNPYPGGDEFLVPLNIGKPGGNPDNVEKDSQARAAVTVMLEDAAGRLITRIGHAAARAGKHPETFCTWLDGLDVRYGAAAMQILRGSLDAAQTVLARDTHQGAHQLLEWLHEAWLDLAGQVRAAELPARLEDVIRTQTKTIPRQWAASIMGGQNGNQDDSDGQPDR